MRNEDKDGKYHRFRTILRQHNIARKETAFEVLVNLFLAKIVDEEENKTNLEFYWKGIAYDNYYDFVDRLQKLYQIGMRKFLKDEVMYISNEQIDSAFWTVKNKRNATKKQIQKYFRELKFFSNNAFSLINVHRKELFEKNTKVLVELVQMWQGLRLKTKEQNQFLGDMFEYFLDNSIKQSEGQFFTPMPITKFIVSSLPLEDKIKNASEPLRTIDYACGSGYFLTEYAHQIKPLVEKYKELEVSKYYENIVGIEKEDRLAKIAKVSAYMYGQDQIHILEKDALSQIAEIKNESFDVLVANPPFAVEGFLLNLTDKEKQVYKLIETTELNSNTNNIQCFFIERAKQIMKRNGTVGIIVPSSILSNSDATHIGTREIILKYFDIVALVELGSGTFGKTGTNTVVLYLKRKAQKPEPAEHYANRVEDYFEGIKEDDKSTAEYQDLYLIERYCEHTELPFDEYKKLFGITAETIANLDELFKTDMFADYKKDFENSTVIKKLKEKRDREIVSLSNKIRKEIEKKNKANKTETASINEEIENTISERKNELREIHKLEINKRLIKYLYAIEKDKHFYFMLAYENKQRVLIVKSPSNNKEQKKFLGYEWSGAKGSEGIKYTGGNSLKDIITPLFNPKDRNDSTKINYLIQQNFLDEKPNNLTNFEQFKDLITYANVTDILDFSRKDFNKAFSLNPKKNITIETKWDLVRVSDAIKKVTGNITKVSNEETLTKGKFPVISQEAEKLISGYTNNGQTITDLPLTVFGDHSCTFKYIDFEFIRGADGTQLLKPKNEFIEKYFFYVIQMVEITNKDKYERHMKYLNDAKIPLPPKSIQEKIVKECETIDKEVEKAQQTIEKAKEEIEEKVMELSSKYKPEKLTNHIEIISGGTPKTDKPEYWNGNIPWLSVADFSNEDRFVETSEKHITKEGLENSSTRYLNKDDIIISARGTVGAMAQLKIPMTFNQSCYGLRTKEKLNPGYLFFIMQQEIKQLKDKASGVTFGAIIRSTFESIKIPVPPLSEQKTLVSKIENFETKIIQAKEIINSSAEKKQKIMDKYLK